MKINISHVSVLNKIEEEIRQAKTAEKSSLMKQHIYAARTLCEMLIDESGQTAEAEGTFVQKVPLQQPVPTPSQPSLSQAEKLQTDDGANGDSLFDF